LAKFGAPQEGEPTEDEIRVYSQKRGLAKGFKWARMYFARLFLTPSDHTDYLAQSAMLTPEYTIIGKHAESGVIVYRIIGGFSYVNADRHNRRLKDLDNSSTIILSLRYMYYCDLDGLDVLEDSIKELQHRGQTVLVSALSPRILPLFSKSQIFNELQQKGSVFKTTRDALLFLSNHQPNSVQVDLNNPHGHHDASPSTGGGGGGSGDGGGHEPSPEQEFVEESQPEHH